MRTLTSHRKLKSGKWLLHAMTALEPRVLLNALLDPLTQPKFVNPLPLPGVMQPTVAGGTQYQATISQFQQDLGLKDINGNALITTVWGYNGSYPGPTIEATVNTPISVTWSNNLVDSSGTPLGHLLPVDTSILHMYPEVGVPVVTHLHGGHTESASDGLPDQWFTPGLLEKGHDYVSNTTYYSNDQEGATLWYHDHAMGITRLNVYAGLAGFYILRDPAEAALNLPSGDYEVPIVIQDRMFTADGQLYIPTAPAAPGQPDPSISPEFFGDTILVNGKAWPALEVEPRKYRFRILNGSDSRVYNLFLSSGQQLAQIGSDGGLLNAPVKLDQLVIGPGERADVVLDFSAYAGQTVIMKNNARTPFPKGTTVDPRTVGQIMAFKVTKPLSGTDTSVLPTTLRASPIQPLGEASVTRQLALYETLDSYGRIMPMLGTVAEGAKMYHDPTTEFPMLGATEVWEFYNATPDAHPLHLHLVQFQVLGRQKYRANMAGLEGPLTDIRLLGKMSPALPNERGWKDTVLMYPGEVTRIKVRFDLPGKFVYHCHILSHEEHDMMRPFEVVDPSANGASTATVSMASVIVQETYQPRVADESGVALVSAKLTRKMRSIVR